MSAPIAIYNGYEVKVNQVESADMIRIFPASRSDYRAWNSGHKRDTGMDRWVSIDELHPADCTCDERSGLACKACCDWHAIHGEEMPYANRS